eukprot:TRINITY_DN1961_c0_g1_i2.p1 TRINITY_DN1961_c0_g1~~TRINITY_DN1961_c0_g1_i2.p1  ORF type:complete len:258 (+),score=50.35 TRINITY_DN1961_c0_g1_i2:189-962(+)
MLATFDSSGRLLSKKELSGKKEDQTTKQHDPNHRDGSDYLRVEHPPSWNQCFYSRQQPKDNFLIVHLENLPMESGLSLRWSVYCSEGHSLLPLRRNNQQCDHLEEPFRCSRKKINFNLQHTSGGDNRDYFICFELMCEGVCLAQTHSNPFKVISDQKRKAEQKEEKAQKKLCTNQGSIFQQSMGQLDTMLLSNRDNVDTFSNTIESPTITTSDEYWSFDFLEILSKTTPKSESLHSFDIEDQFRTQFGDFLFEQINF